MPLEGYRKEAWPASGSPAGRVDLEACQAMIDYAEKIADLMEEGHPFSKPDIVSYPAGLRLVWGRFIENTAGIEAVFAPRERSKKASASARHERTVKQSKSGVVLTAKLLLERYRAAKSQGKLKKTVQGDIRDEFNVSPRQQDRMIEPHTWLSLKS